MADLDSVTTDLDELWKAEKTASWLRISRKTLLEAARKGRIPCVRLNDRVIRFHPRTILRKLGGAT